MHEILPRLSASDVFRFKFVSKFWWNTISNPKFIQALLISHSQQPPGYIGIYGSGFLYRTQEYFHETYLSNILNQEETAHAFVMSSCNGLVLVAAPLKMAYYILNPATRQYRKLPSPPMMMWDCLVVFDDTLNKYKLLGWDEHSICMLVLKSDTKWHIYDFDRDLTLRTNRPAVCNGWFFWMTFSDKILALNNKTGQFRVVIQPPGLYGKYDYVDDRFAAVDGSLYLLYIHGSDRFTQRNKCYILWRLDDFAREHWTRVYEKKRSSCLECCIQTSSGDDSAPWKLVINEIRDNTLTRGGYSEGDRYHLVPHVNSLIWLD